MNIITAQEHICFPCFPFCIYPDTSSKQQLVFIQCGPTIALTTLQTRHSTLHHFSVLIVLQTSVLWTSFSPSAQIVRTIKQSTWPPYKPEKLWDCSWKWYQWTLNMLAWKREGLGWE